MIMGISAPFMQAACAKAKQEAENIISIISTIADPSIYQFSCQGEIKVQSIKNGAPVEQTYTDLSSANLSIQADAETEIKILGNVTDFSPAAQYQGWGYADTLLAKSIVFNCDTLQTIKVSGKSSYDAVSTVENMIFVNCTALQTLYCSGCTGLTSLDLAANTALQTLDCHNCTGFTSLDLAANTALQTLECNNCTGLTSLDLSANTELTYLGCGYCTGLTSLDLSANTELTHLSCSGCTGLTSLDLAANTALQTLYCYDCTGLTSLDLAANTALQTLYCNNCTGLTSLDLAANTALQTLECNNCTGLTSIKYGASNSDVSTSIAGAITDATAADGTVYTDSQGAYYSTIADAATNKGWTIEQL